MNILQVFCFHSHHRKLYPELKDNLEQFRKHLKESAHEMAPLKVWQLQGIGYFGFFRVGSPHFHRTRCDIFHLC